MLTAIICTYNRAKYIGPLLESIAANDLAKEEYEILLVDNNCTDNTREICESFAKAHKDINFRFKSLLKIRKRSPDICGTTMSTVIRII